MGIFYILANSSKNRKSLNPIEETKGKRVKSQNDDFVVSLMAYIFGWRKNPQVLHHPARIDDNTILQQPIQSAIQFPRSLRKIVPDRLVEFMRPYLPSRLCLCDASCAIRGLRVFLLH
jgi:hypothetical protein